MATAKRIVLSDKDRELVKKAREAIPLTQTQAAMEAWGLTGGVAKKQWWRLEADPTRAINAEQLDAALQLLELELTEFKVRKLKLK